MTAAPAVPASEATPVARLRGIRKEYPGVLAVDDVDLDILPGEVHVVAGENGAGKSTLMKLLSQVERPDGGTVEIGGERVAHHGPMWAQRHGVAMVHQEFALAPHLTVAENLFLGREPMRMGMLDRRAAVRQARELLTQVGLDLAPERRVSSLAVAERQRIEIAKALAIDARLVIMDEPTAVLAEREIDGLFEVIESLTGRGVAVLYISHRLEEIFRIGDRVTVMRDGAVVKTVPTKELDQDGLVRLMVGRDIKNLYPKPEVKPGEVRLRAAGITRRGVLEDCSFEVRGGEIVGLAGLVGAGRTELARALFGADPISAGSVELDGEPLRRPSPSAAIEAGLGYLTEDRKGDGLALQLAVDQNVTLAHLPMRGPLLDLAEERRVALRRREQLDIRTPTIKRRVEALSGGNQQKVMVAKWLETRAGTLIFDEPGRGIDVGAKAEMFELIGHLAQEGRAIVLISSHLPELLNMCDRILVMREGRIAGEVAREEFSEERVMALATGAEEAA
jgi:ribose transport system ATP-binding protein